MKIKKYFSTFSKDNGDVGLIYIESLTDINGTYIDLTQDNVNYYDFIKLIATNKVKNNDYPFRRTLDSIINNK